MTVRSSLLDSALLSASRGWPVFPLVQGNKYPALPSAHPTDDPLQGSCRGQCGQDGHGVWDATTDFEKIERWWTLNPGANVGIQTGVAFDAFDIDVPDGLQSLSGLLSAEKLESLVGPTVVTGRGGLHIYVGVTGVGNKVKFFPNCDWRGVGGYVVGVPSIHPNGTQYKWLDECGPDERPILPPPEWLVTSLTSSKVQTSMSANLLVGTTRHGLLALLRELGRLAIVREGSRNAELNRTAFCVGRLIARGQVSTEVAITDLLIVARRIGLGETEILRTVKSGMSAGMRSLKNTDPR